ncbi:hypothetical protein Cni_G12895 [Canna indica]|uniref:Cytochrome P450 n=1 Tax=Canna indica TaxID=4628 RepID=A0AAQ3KAC0_9LILI|nr:hypothetical protein Cni_G12895 [Canna indica]
MPLNCLRLGGLWAWSSENVYIPNGSDHIRHPDPELPLIHLVRDLCSRCGPIFTIRKGAHTLIVVTNPELAHEALIEKGQLFASRPVETTIRTVFICDKFTVNSAVYGPRWCSLRRNMVSGMLSASRLRDFHPAHVAALDRLIAQIRAEALTSDDGV